MNEVVKREKERREKEGQNGDKGNWLKRESESKTVIGKGKVQE